jgi:HPt (histidine-containing phosphotransfer) domain-containing protein
MSDIYDEAEALERVGGNRELLREVADIFLADLPRMLDEIGRAVAERDRAEIFRTAHRLKGSVANFSAHRASAAALVLERMAAREAPEGVDEALAALRHEIELVRGALMELVAGAPGRTAEQENSMREGGGAEGGEGS